MNGSGCESGWGGGREGGMWVRWGETVKSVLLKYYHCNCNYRILVSS